MRQVDNTIRIIPMRQVDIMIRTIRKIMRRQVKHGKNHGDHHYTIRRCRHGEKHKRKTAAQTIYAALHVIIDAEYLCENVGC
jgi:hypothetical protein